MPNIQTIVGSKKNFAVSQDALHQWFIALILTAVRALLFGVPDLYIKKLFFGKNLSSFCILLVTAVAPAFYHRLGIIIPVVACIFKAIINTYQLVFGTSDFFDSFSEYTLDLFFTLHLYSLTVLALTPKVRVWGCIMVVYYPVFALVGLVALLKSEYYMPNSKVYIYENIAKVAHIQSRNTFKHLYTYTEPWLNLMYKSTKETKISIRLLKKLKFQLTEKAVFTALTRPICTFMYNLVAILYLSFLHPSYQSIEPLLRHKDSQIIAWPSSKSFSNCISYCWIIPSKTSGFVWMSFYFFQIYFDRSLVFQHYNKNLADETLLKMLLAILLPYLVGCVIFGLFVTYPIETTWPFCNLNNITNIIPDLNVKKLSSRLLQYPFSLDNSKAKRHYLQRCHIYCQKILFVSFVGTAYSIFVNFLTSILSFSKTYDSVLRIELIVLKTVIYGFNQTFALWIVTFVSTSSIPTAAYYCGYINTVALLGSYAGYYTTAVIASLTPKYSSSLLSFLFILISFASQWSIQQGIIEWYLFASVKKNNVATKAASDKDNSSTTQQTLQGQATFARYKYNPKTNEFVLNPNEIQRTQISKFKCVKNGKPLKLFVNARSEAGSTASQNLENKQFYLFFHDENDELLF